MSTDLDATAIEALPTMSGLYAATARHHPDAIAARYLRDGEWVDVDYATLWERAKEVAHGLINLDVGVGDRVAVLANTRYEFMLLNAAINAVGAIIVPVYPTSAADEVEWVVGNSGAVVLFCEDEAQAAKVATVRPNLGELRQIVMIEGFAPDTISLDELIEAGQGGDDAVIDERIAAVGHDDPCLIIYTSGTTGRPKGVVLGNRGFAAARHSVVEMDIFRHGDVMYLFLPLAHIFGQLMIADAVQIGATTAFWSGDANAIVADLGQLKPNVLPSVPRIFEKVYSVAMSMVPDEYAAFVEPAVAASMRVRLARRDGVEPDPKDVELFELADGAVFEKVRAIFGGNITLAISGAAPIAKEILEFFYAAGVPIYEGWGMTETTAIGTLNLPDGFRFGTIGRSVAGADVRVADDGEIEMAGPMLLKEYWKNPDATTETFTDDGYLRTGDLGSIDEDGFVTITGRKKDIIITAGGKNLTPANIEGDLRRSPYISQAVMYGDRRPYPVALITLDPEGIVPWAREQGLSGDVETLAGTDEVRKLIEDEIASANARYAKVGQIKRFRILGHDFTVDGGELTPSLKLKRNVVYDRYADEIAQLYD